MKNYEYVGQQIGDQKLAINSESPAQTLNELYRKLRHAWCRQTAYPACQKEWVPEDPSYGQCAITAMFVHDLFGGKIYKLHVDGGGTHYFNVIDGTVVDLGSEQFTLYHIPVPYENGFEVDPRYCGTNPDTRKRYELLCSRLNLESVSKQQLS